MLLLTVEADQKAMKDNGEYMGGPFEEKLISFGSVQRLGDSKLFNLLGEHKSYSIMLISGSASSQSCNVCFLFCWRILFINTS